jgi:hypothetical protein
MAWSGNRPRREGGGIRGLALAWALAKKNLVPPSVSNKTQVSTATNPAAPTNNNRIKDGLVSEWWFDEGSGTIVKDQAELSIETDLTLSAGGGLWRQDAAKNNRWYMELSAGGALYNLNPTEINSTYINPNATGLTLEAWVKPLSPNGANPGPGRIISFSNASTGSTDVTFMLGHGTWSNAGYNAANYHSRVLVGNPSNSGELTELWTGDDTSTSTLQHLVMTCDLLGAGTSPTGNQQAETKLYLDGVLKSTRLLDDPDGFFTSWDTAHTLKIGYETGHVREFKGGVYLVAMYNKALNQGEINNNFSEGVVSVTDAYSAGRHLTIEDVTASTVNAGETISVNIIADGSRYGPASMTLGASSTSGTYGVDFVFDDTTKTMAIAQQNVTAELSCSPTLSGDINIVAYIATATGPNIISSPGQNLSEKTFKGISDQVAPEVMFKSPNPVHVVTTQNAADQEVVSVGVSRAFFEPITVTVSGAGDPGNDATYAWIREDGTYSDFPSEATYTVSADNLEKWAKVHSYSGTNGTVFTDGDVLSATVVSGNLSGGGALTVRAAASATNVTIDHPDFGMGVEPTSSNTGYRLDTTALTDWVGTARFMDEGTTDSSPYIAVPTDGLTISGRKFTGPVEVWCNNAIRFVDCYFEGERRLVNMPYYLIKTHNSNSNTSFIDSGKKLKLDYCTFWGARSVSVNGVFESINYCSFDWTVGDHIRFQSSDSEDHDFLVANCWFGPHMNILDDLTLNGNDGMYAVEELGVYSNGQPKWPHADMGQLYLAKINSITHRQCTFAAVADKWYDDTTNPTNVSGSNPDKIWQIDGSSLNWGNGQKATSVNIWEMDRNWIYGTGNSWCAMSEAIPGGWPNFEWRMKSNLIALEANGSLWNIDVPSIIRVSDGNNRFMRTGTERLQIPQVAIDAGKRITHTDGMSGGNSVYLSCERWIKGLDIYTASWTGLNESGRTSFDTRSTPA